MVRFKGWIWWLLFCLLWLLSGCQEPTPSSSSSGYKHTKATMRAYTVRGVTYTPVQVQTGQTMYGISSWYGKDFHGKKTSNGEAYNMYARTAAHKTWPMNTIVRVTNLQNGHSTVVRINDRGPFVAGRVIDCSYLAGKELGLDKSGVAKVKLEVLGNAKTLKRPIVKTKAPVAIKPPKRGDFYVIQLGAFHYFSGAKRLEAEYRRLPKAVRIKEEKPLYRVWVVGFSSRAEAEVFQKRHHLERATIMKR